MKMKTSQLAGAALDWAVAKCEGATDFRFDTVATYWITLDGKDRALSKGWAQSFNPSTDWAQGGPIIEREGLYLKARNDAKEWLAGALSMNRLDGKPGPLYSGPTPLIAATRSYVASKLGDEVDVPDELISA